METVTLTFNSNSPFAVRLAALLKSAPDDVSVTRKPATSKRKRKSNYEITLEALKEVREGKGNQYDSADELFEKLGITLAGKEKSSIFAAK